MALGLTDFLIYVEVDSICLWMAQKIETSTSAMSRWLNTIQYGKKTTIK